MKVGLYLRVSSDDQRERATIKTQREGLLKYCGDGEFPIYDFYSDDGITGTIALGERPQGARLLRDARAGKFDTVFIYNVRRLGRDARHILNAVFDLEEAGLKVQSITEPFDTSTPAGRFFLTILAGEAGFDRDIFVELSIAATDRHARDGAWLGGIVPYGYRVVGKKKDARLVVSEEPIPGCGLSEADVIRLIYKLTVEQDWSCIRIADHLNAIGVPPAYVRDDRAFLQTDGTNPLHGKRKARTQGIWRAGRIRNMMTGNTTYKGIHCYGQRSKREREVIERAVPAIVDAETFDRAREILRSHMLFSRKNAKRRYLLRGLMKCGLCGLTYIGTGYTSSQGKIKAYYCCNGKHGARGIYGENGQRCPSTAISCDIEDAIWQDIEGFLRNPGDVLKQLEERQGDQAEVGARLQADITKLQKALATKASERERVVTAYRRGFIEEADLSRQLEQLQREEKLIEGQLHTLSDQAESVEAARSHIRGAEELLCELHQRLDTSLDWETKRQLIERLVAWIRVDTTEGTCKNGKPKKQAVVTVRYVFARPVKAPRDVSAAMSAAMSAGSLTAPLAASGAPPSPLATPLATPLAELSLGTSTLVADRRDKGSSPPPVESARGTLRIERRGQSSHGHLQAAGAELRARRDETPPTHRERARRDERAKSHPDADTSRRRLNRRG